MESVVADVSFWKAKNSSGHTLLRLQKSRNLTTALNLRGVAS